VKRRFQKPGSYRRRPVDGAVQQFGTFPRVLDSVPSVNARVGKGIWMKGGGLVTMEIIHFGIV